MNSPENENRKMNPQIQTMEIGTRTLRKITIYPLAMGDQLKLSDMITEALQVFFLKGKKDNDTEFVNFMLKLVRERLDTIIDLAVDASERQGGGSLLPEMTNVQVLEFARIIYQTNYEALVGKLKDLLKTKTMENLSVLGRSSQESPETTDTDSKTSTESPGETEELPSDK